MNAFERRTRACQEALAADADAVVCFPGENMYYLSGFHDEPMERHLFLFVARKGDPIFVAPELYEAQIRDASWVEDVRTWADGDDPRRLVENVLIDLDIVAGNLLVDDQLWAQFTQDLEAAAPTATFGLASEALAPLRMRKDETELAAMRRAAAIADDVCERVRAMGEEAIGMTEAELARHIETLCSDAGADALSFDVIVGSGPNGAKPHHRHSDREIEAGDPVVLDFGVFCDHYPSDQTRTVVFAGDPPDGFEDAFDAVKAAQEAAVQAVEPGVKAERIDQVARDIITEAGYGEQFIHRTGHGVGLDVHEDPYIVAGNEMELEPGMVFSVEPGVYRSNEFGVRIEDLVVVTEDGHERLNHSPRHY
ncbi:Xaa-Pro peptidase family protein [Haladaptatus sp. DYSN1]|uniref:M24 family metallopeptidase n=1 Tax=unclassified Haladaptatus TaxID=2622732 RepID=UPI002404E13E|nr:Xaa-Pro peptidase family protein [Haladaptatus sp. DYSN1]